MTERCCTDCANMTGTFLLRFDEIRSVPLAVCVLLIGTTANARAQSGWQANRKPSPAVQEIETDAATVPESSKALQVASELRDEKAFFANGQMREEWQASSRSSHPDTVDIAKQALLKVNAIAEVSAVYKLPKLSDEKPLFKSAQIPEEWQTYSKSSPPEVDTATFRDPSQILYDEIEVVKDAGANKHSEAIRDAPYFKNARVMRGSQELPRSVPAVVDMASGTDNAGASARIPLQFDEISQGAVNNELPVNELPGLPINELPKANDENSSFANQQAPEYVSVTEGAETEPCTVCSDSAPQQSESYVYQSLPVDPLANQNGGSSDLLTPYLARLHRSERTQANGSLPGGYLPWWANHVTQSVGIEASPSHFSLDRLLHRALENSPHIRVAATAPNIRQAQLLEESAQFDWLSFLSSKYEDTNDPIGNTLTTGNNANRFVQQDWNTRGGFRRRTLNGGEIDITQQLGYLDNNSRFLIPGDQGNSRLELNYRHPLMRGRGRAVNESLIVLANLDFQAAGDDLLQQIQTHLVELTETYWELVRARSELLQRQRLLQRAERVLHQLNGRAEVDALDRQVYRAKAAVARRRAEIARAVTSIKNAESRLRLLVNDDQIIGAARTEFIPTDLPSSEVLPIKLEDAIATALTNRPDISRAIRSVKSTSVKLGVAKNDLLPKLDLLVGSYVAGLDADSDAFNSWVNQFRDGRPGFNVGFEFEVPVGNRAARAREQRRRWEMERSTQQFRVVVETGLTEVELAVREVDTAYQEMQGRYLAMVAANNESEYLADRWQTLPGLNDSVTQLLENLLDSQERLADEEAAYADAQYDYSVAAVKLKQAMGTLFIVRK